MSHFARYIFFALMGFFLATIMIGLIEWLANDRPPWMLMGGILGAVIALPNMAGACSQEAKAEKASEK